jgi:uncharacterized coiled-coil DUF342 family protein
MEVLIILSYMFLIGLCTWLGLTVHQHSSVVDRYKKQFNHQKEELSKAARINEKVRTERDAYRELAYKYAREADKVRNESRPLQFNKEQLSTLIQLCHPDKHGGKESAVKVTQVLIAMRNQAR